MAEGTDHSAFVMCKCVAILIVLASKAFGVVFARFDRTLFWSLFHVGKHVCREILKDPPAIGMRTAISVRWRRIIYFDGRSHEVAGAVLYNHRSMARYVK
jgi:hypothetical protein